MGRPSTLSAGEKQSVLKHLAEGISVSALARKFSTSMQTIMRVRSEGFLPGSV
nr:MULTISPECIES: helix-turn-helix domain-containing protein [Gluconobacter]